MQYCTSKYCSNIHTVNDPKTSAFNVETMSAGLNTDAENIPSNMENSASQKLNVGSSSIKDRKALELLHQREYLLRHGKLP